MRQFHDKKRNNNEQHQVSPTPGPLVISNLLQRSIGNSFEKAKTEWQLVEHIPNTSNEFVGNCELCNHVNHKENWLIENINTKKKLKVGSDCIKRFITFSGMKSQLDSNIYFEIKQKEIKKEQEIALMYKEIILNPLPLARRCNKFRKLILDLLNEKGSTTSHEDIRDFITKILKKSLLKHQEVHKLWTLLNEPSEFTMQRETKKYKEFVLKEGETWNKKGKVTSITLSKSNIYNNPYSKY